MRSISWLGLLLLVAFTPASHGNEPLFVSKAKHEKYLAMVPKGVFTDEELSRIIFYDRESVPRAYQHNGAFHDAMYNISPGPAANPPEAFGNANREFPWNTGGLDESPNASDFKALIHPVDASGKQIPMRVSIGPLPAGFVNENSNWHLGKYPVGMKAVEFLAVDGVVFEVRTLEKTRDGSVLDVRNNWKPRWYRAVRDRDELMTVVDKPYREMLQERLQDKLPVRVLRNSHPTEVIASKTIVEELPAMTSEQRRAINARPFKEVTDVAWHIQDGLPTYAPSGGFVADKFQGGHFAAGNCLDCHSTVLKHAQLIQGNRDWYGRVRGQDGLFSAPMCDESCVSGNGFDTRSAWNRKLIEAGLLVSE